jgi:manganese/iron transport system permease protein
VGAVLGVASSLSGVYLSYYSNLPSGPSIVLVSSTLFVLVWLFHPRTGLVLQRLRPFLSS